MAYNIEIPISPVEGVQRVFLVEQMHLQIEPSEEPRYRNHQAPFVQIKGKVVHKDADGKPINSLEGKSFDFVANTKLADATTGRIEPTLVMDTDPNSDTFGQSIEDPNEPPFNPTVEEFVLLAESPTQGGTLWQEISGRIAAYVNNVESYGRFD